MLPLGQQRKYQNNRLTRIESFRHAKPALLCDMPRFQAFEFTSRIYDVCSRWTLAGSWSSTQNGFWVSSCIAAGILQVLCNEPYSPVHKNLKIGTDILHGSGPRVCGAIFTRLCTPFCTGCWRQLALTTRGWWQKGQCWCNQCWQHWVTWQSIILHNYCSTLRWRGKFLSYCACLFMNLSRQRKNSLSSKMYAGGQQSFRFCHGSIHIVSFGHIAVQLKLR